MCKKCNYTEHTPLVSVIVPVYKVEKYLERCLNSICAQTYDNIEILVVDDGSPDRCGEICDEFQKKDSRIRVFHQENQGLSGARNTGIDAAAGKYLAFVDSDDFVAPEFIETMVKIALESGSDIVQVGSISVFDEAAKFGPEILQKVRISSKNVTMTGEDACLALLESTVPELGVVWNKIYKAELFCDLRFPLGKIHEDDALIYRLYWASHHVTVNESKLHFYQEGRTDSILNAKYSTKRLDGLEAKRGQYEFFASIRNMKLCEKAKAEFVRESVRHITALKQSSIEGKEKIISRLYADAVPILLESLVSKNLSLRSKAGMVARFLGIMKKE